ncbi:MAG TPA: hypothetical protein VK473_18680 [Terriglobales bacterium]|nr:hypothetical protein [Terriglobales bacterium]
MKYANRVLFALGLLLLAATGAFAQERVIANVPFGFTAEGHEMPAGKYLVSEVSDGVKVLAIHNDASNQTLLVNTFSGDPTGETKLTFHRYGETYFLAAVSTPNSRYELGSSKAEKQLRAKNPGNETIVAVLGQ